MGRARRRDGSAALLPDIERLRRLLRLRRPRNIRGVGRRSMRS